MLIESAFDTLLTSVDYSTSQQLERLYQDSRIWESDDLEKARVVAPVGTIKRIGETEYIKTAEGWRYKAKGGQKKQQEESSQNKNPKQEEQGSHKTGQSTQSTIQPGHQIVAPDGTKGKVLENDGKIATVEYVKDGEKKTAQVQVSILEQRKQNGEIQHHSNPSTLQEHHKKQAEDMAIEGKSSSAIVSHLKNAGVDEDEAMEHVVSLKKQRKEKQSDNKEGGSSETKEDKSSSSKSDESFGKDDSTDSDDEYHEDHDESVDHQAKNETNHEQFIQSKQPKNVVDTNAGVEFKKEPELDDKKSQVEDEDPETQEVNKKFGAFARQIRSVINGSMKGCLVYGSGGVGKTYTIAKELEKAGKKQFIPGVNDPGDDDYDYVKITGRVTPVAMYKLMHQHKDKILVFDDCNSVLENKDSLDMLKGALDTSGDGTITWGSGNPPKGDDGKPLDQTLKFGGKVMFATNLPIKELTKKDKDLAAVLTRGPGIDLTMSPKQTLKRIQSIAKDPKTGKLTNLKFPGTPNYTEKDMKDILDYLDKNKNNKDLDISVRTIGTLLGLKKEAEKDGADWKEDADYAVLKKSEVDNVNSIFKAQEARRNAALGKGPNIDILESKIKFFKSMNTGNIVSHEHVEGVLYDENSKPFPENKNKDYNKKNREQAIEKSFDVLLNS